MNEKKKIPIVRYLCYLLVVTVLFTGVTFSRYSMTTSGNTTAPLSRFHCTYTVDDISSTSYPNVNYWLNEEGAASTARSLRYTVSNFDDSAVSDVDVEAHLRLYLPAEMANNLAFQIGTMDMETGTVSSYTPEIVLPELIFARSRDEATGSVSVDRTQYAAHEAAELDTAEFNNYYDDNLTGTAEETLVINGTLDPKSGTGRTLTVESKGVSETGETGSGLKFSIAAAEATTGYSLGFQRGENENDYAPQFFLELEAEVDFYTFDITLPSMTLLAEDGAQSRQYIVYLTLTERITSDDFSAYWTGNEEHAADLAQSENGAVDSNDLLITQPPADESEWYTYNGARVVGYHFDQTVGYADKDEQTTVRVQCLYDRKGGYSVNLYHVAPISENSTASYVHPLTVPEGQGITFSDGTFTSTLTEGSCEFRPEDKLDLSSVIADPLYKAAASPQAQPGNYIIYHVLSKSYEVNFRVLFVQASRSGV